VLVYYWLQGHSYGPRIAYIYRTPREAPVLLVTGR